MRVFIDKRATKKDKLMHQVMQSALINENIEVRIGHDLWQVEAHLLKTLVEDEARIIFWLKAPEELVEEIIVLNANLENKCRSVAISDCLLRKGVFKPAILANLRFQAQAIALDREAKLMNDEKSFLYLLPNKSNPRLS